MSDWAAGVRDYPVSLNYGPRDYGQECDECGAKPGFWCVETKFLPGRVKQCIVPVRSHIIALPYKQEVTVPGEIPVEHQALSSGRLRSGC